VPNVCKSPHGIHSSQYRESVLIRSATEAKLRESDRPECEGLERDDVGGRTGNAVARFLTVNHQLQKEGKP
jgi:hypothetical protein